MVKQIPNIITSLSLLSGLAGIYFCSKYNFVNASYAILIAMVFDFLDGAFARALKSSSDFGKQFDSLADLISFGVVPGLIAFGLIKNQSFIEVEITGTNILPFIGYAIPLLSAIRLARFNVDVRQATIFYGLPTPANALFWSSLPILSKFSTGNDPVVQTLLHPYFIFSAAIILSIMLVSNIKMISLKFKNLSWKENWQKYLFVLAVVSLFLILKLYALPFIIAAYILLSLVFVFIEK